MAKKKPSRQASEARRDEGWGSIDSKKLDEFWDWLEAGDAYQD